MDRPDRTVKAAWSETKALTDVLQEQIAFDLPLERDLFRAFASACTLTQGV